MQIYYLTVSVAWEPGPAQLDPLPRSPKLVIKVSVGLHAFWSLVFSSKLSWWLSSFPCGCKTEAAFSCSHQPGASQILGVPTVPCHMALLAVHMTIYFLQGQQEHLSDFYPSYLPVESYITNLIIIFTGAAHTPGEHTRGWRFGEPPSSGELDFETEMNLTWSPGSP